jgi:hypothetical protein
MNRGEQKLVTAWQAVELQHTCFAPPDPSVFYFMPSQQKLCAVGGTEPNKLAVWDLHRETCASQISQVQHCSVAHCAALASA